MSEAVIYLNMAEFIAASLKMLNAFSKEHEFEDGPSKPYLGKIPVKMEGEVIGYFVDELGGEWCYTSGTPDND